MWCCLTFEDVITSSGSHPERMTHPECTSAVLVNAHEIAKRVSALLAFLDLNPKINSGFRTKSANSAAGGATNSAHLYGMAVDLYDPEASLCRTLKSNPDLLDEFDLYMEDPSKTRSWTHLSIRKTDSGHRIFSV